MEICLFSRGYFLFSTWAWKNSSDLSFDSSDLSFDSSEVSFDSSEEFLLTHVDIYFYPGSYWGNSSEEMEVTGVIGEDRRVSEWIRKYRR